MPVNGFSRQEAAERAGIEVDYVDRQVALGIVRPGNGKRFSTGDVRRLGLVATLERAGLPLEGIAHQIASGQISLDFLDGPAFDHFSALSQISFADLSLQTGIAVDLLMVVREAIGLAMPSPTDRVREIELEIVPLIAAELQTGYPPQLVERLMRTVGDNLRRYVLAEAEAFKVSVIDPVAHRPGNEIGAAAGLATDRLRGPNERALMAIFRAQQAHAWTSNMLEGFEQDLASAGLIGGTDRQPAMCSLDPPAIPG